LKDRQHNGQNEKDKRTNNGLQNIRMQYGSIRETGNWTNELYQFISQYDPGDDSELTEVVSEEVTPMMTTLQKKRKEMRNDRRKSIIGTL
jgi:hypothetical protein